MRKNIGNNGKDLTSCDTIVMERVLSSYYNSGLVVVEHDWVLRVAACPVQPHVALRLRFFACFPEHLQRRFIGMQHYTENQTSAQFLVDWLQIVPRAAQHPVGHRLPGEIDLLAVEIPLYPVDRARPSQNLCKPPM